VGSRLDGHSQVVLAGSEQWLPASLAAGIRRYVERGGHVLSLGVGSLLRSVRVRGGRAFDPTSPAPVDALGARPGSVAAAGRGPLRVTRDELGLFRGAAGKLAAFGPVQPFTAPGSALAAAGIGSGGTAIVAYRLGRGTVVDIGLVGFGSALARNRAARALVSRAWSLA
jgi:hypothetical protein